MFNENVSNPGYRIKIDFLKKINPGGV